MDWNFLPQTIKYLDNFFTNHIFLGTLFSAAIIIYLYNYAPIYLNKLKDKIKNNENPLHGFCPKQVDAINFIKFSEDVRNKQFILKYLESIQQQMNIAEQSLTEFLYIEDKIFIKALKEQTEDQEKIEHEIYKFKLMMKHISYIIKDKIRSYIKENHLSEKLEEEFNNYKKTKNAAMLEIIKSYIDMLYDDRYFSVSLAKILILHDENKTLFFDCFDSMFNQIRKISIDTSKKIEDLEKRLEERLKSSFDIRFFY